MAELSPSAIFISVTNPVDVITYKIFRISGFDWRRVIGTGTLIDTLRSADVFQMKCDGLSNTARRSFEK